MEAPLYRSRYPDHDVLARADTWDAVTRELVLARVARVPPRRYLSEGEWDALEALADTVVPQDDRPPELRVPLVPWLDDRLRRGEGPGYRFEGLPPDGEFWRRVAAGLDREAARAGYASFARAPPAARRDLFAALADAPHGESWEGMPLDLVVQQVLNEFARGYYAHPYAWDEVGFPGPKFPGIYARTSFDDPDEPQEAR